LTYLFIVTRALRIGPTGSPVKISGGAPEQLCVKFFKLCRTFVATCKIENLPRLAVVTTLHFAKLSRTFQIYSHTPQLDLKIANDVFAEAKAFLTGAKEPCQQKCQNAEVFGNAVDETLRLLAKE
jgi:hypothetical protein